MMFICTVGKLAYINPGEMPITLIGGGGQETWVEQGTNPTVVTAPTPFYFQLKCESVSWNTLLIPEIKGKINVTV
jgi:hypothetical protein